MFITTKKTLLGIIFALLVINCGSENLSSIEDLQQAKEIVRQKDGNYKITCKDGSTETISLKQLQNEEVCLTKKSGWILASGSFSRIDKTAKDTCSISVRTYFFENNLTKVRMNGFGCKLGKHVFQNCEFSDNKTTCHQNDDASKITKIVITSHQEFILFDNNNVESYFKQGEAKTFNGILHNVRESSLTDWQRCKKLTQSGNIPTKEIIKSCGGDDSQILITCMTAEHAEKPEEAIIKVGAVIPAKTILETIEGKITSPTKVNGFNFYYRQNVGIGVYPLEGNPVIRGFDNNKDFDDQRMGFYTSTSNPLHRKYGSIYNPNRCGTNINMAYKDRAVFFKFQ